MTETTEEMAQDEFAPEVESEDLDDVVLWATVQYEEGTSGPIQTAEGVLVDGDESLTIVNPDTGVATIIGDRFIVRVDIQQMDVSDEDDDDDDE